MSWISGISDAFSQHFLSLSNAWTQYGHALEIPGQANQMPLTGN